MNLLLDTHILLWWHLDHPDLGKKYRARLVDVEAKGEAVSISIMSLWEIAMLVEQGKYQVAFSLDEWFQELEQDPGINLLPLNGQIILESLRLGKNFPKDPADRLITATARHHGLCMMTHDKAIRRSGLVAMA